MALLITPGQWGDAPQMIEVLDRIRVPGPLGGRPRSRPGDATSSTPSRNRRTNAPTVDAKAARAQDQPASTLTATSAATRSSGPSTTSRTRQASLCLPRHRHRSSSPLLAQAVNYRADLSQSRGGDEARPPRGHAAGARRSGSALPGDREDAPDNTEKRHREGKGMEKGTVPKKGAHRDPDQQQDRPEARDEQPQQETAVGRAIHPHVTCGPRPAQKHGSGHREKQRHRRPEPPMQPSTPHRSPVHHPLR